MKQGSSAIPKITHEQACIVCGQFIKIADKREAYVTALLAAGFEAFTPYVQYKESLCYTPQEIEMHHRYRVEMARERLSNPWPPFRNGKKELEFRSPYIKQLELQRDEENGVPLNRIELTFPPSDALWRKEVDPAKRNESKLLCQLDRALFDAKWKQRNMDARQILRSECHRHATRLSEQFAFDQRGRYELFRAVSEEMLVANGFGFDKKRSKPNYPIVSKPVSDDWLLCWVLEQQKELNVVSPLLGEEWVAGYFVPALELRHQSVKGDCENAKTRSRLILRYHDIIEGFFSAYQRFETPAELETIIRAHLTWLKMLLPDIEEACRRGLAEAMPGSA